MGQKRKRNHWVPQAYLKTFAADAPKREKIWRFSNRAGDPELKPIANVAVRFYLYAPKDQDGRRDYSFEEKLSELERWFADPVWLELCHGMIDLSWPALRKMVSLLTAVMYLRNPAQLETAKAMHRQMVRAISSMAELPDAFEHGGKMYQVDKSSWPGYRDAGDDDIKRMWISNVRTATWLAERLMQMRWSMLMADEPVFITSDNPVTIMHPSLAFKGLNNPQTLVSFPLSPTRMLMMDNMHKEPENQYYPLKHHPATTNLLLWRNANEHMFSHRHPDIVCAEMLEEAERMG